MKYIIKITTRV